MAQCIDVEKGTMRQVHWEDVVKIDKWFETLMGEDLQSRKEYIKENLHKYKMED